MIGHPLFAGGQLRGLRNQLGADALDLGKACQHPIFPAASDYRMGPCSGGAARSHQPSEQNKHTTKQNNTNKKIRKFWASPSIIKETSAPSVSLSPNLISSVTTVSFSLM